MKLTFHDFFNYLIHVNNKVLHFFSEGRCMTLLKKHKLFHKKAKIIARN